MQVITDQLENATTELRQTKRRIRRELEDELSHRESALNDLTAGTRQLERAWDAEREQSDDELEEAHERYREVEEERDRLRGQVIELRSRLARAQEREARTQERCRILEQTLDAVEPRNSSDAPDTDGDRATADSAPPWNGTQIVTALPSEWIGKALSESRSTRGRGGSRDRRRCADGIRRESGRMWCSAASAPGPWARSTWDVRRPDGWSRSRRSRSSWPRKDGFRTRFAQEVAATRRVSGVFTAAVVEADPEADLPWLATAYVAAPSLARLVLACARCR